MSVTDDVVRLIAGLQEAGGSMSRSRVLRVIFARNRTKAELDEILAAAEGVEQVETAEGPTWCLRNYQEPTEEQRLQALIRNFNRDAMNTRLSAATRAKASSEARILQEKLDALRAPKPADAPAEPSAEEADESFDFELERRRAMEKTGEARMKALFELSQKMAAVHPPAGIEDLVLSLEGKMTSDKAKRILKVAAKVGEFQAERIFGAETLGVVGDTLELGDLTEEQFEDYLKTL